MSILKLMKRYQQGIAHLFPLIILLVGLLAILFAIPVAQRVQKQAQTPRNICDNPSIPENIRRQLCPPPTPPVGETACLLPNVCVPEDTCPARKQVAARCQVPGQENLVCCNLRGDSGGQPPASPTPPAGGGGIINHPNLVSYWKMDETTNNSCPGGKDVCDSKGNNHGINMPDDYDGPQILAGKIGNARFFSPPRNVYVDSADGSLNFANAITVEAWVNLRGLGSGLIVFKRGLGYTQLGITDDSRVFFQFGCQGTGSRRITSNSTLIANQWYHLAGTSDLATQRLYIDGESVSAEQTSAYCNPAERTSLTISSDTSSFRSRIDEVAIFNQALSAEEIAQHAGVN